MKAYVERVSDTAAYIQVHLAHTSTVCPVVLTVCPVVSTVCPEVSTVCPVVSTVCPVVSTNTTGLLFRPGFGAEER